jgi:hypothetical protein
MASRRVILLQMSHEPSRKQEERPSLSLATPSAIALDVCWRRIDLTSSEPLF